MADMHFCSSLPPWLVSDVASATNYATHYTEYRQMRYYTLPNPNPSHRGAQSQACPQFSLFPPKAL